MAQIEKKRHTALVIKNFNDIKYRSILRDSSSALREFGGQWLLECSTGVAEKSVNEKRLEMSGSYEQRLPPIGFEGLIDEPVRPLKKKKRRRGHKLKAVALASQSFKSESPHLEPNIIESPDPNFVDTRNYLGIAELRLRKADGLTREERAKRFTIADLEGQQPEWLKNKGSVQKEMARQDVKDLLRKLYMAPERDRIDYVILHKIPEDSNDLKEILNAKRRKRFEKLIEEEGFLLEHEVIDDYDYCKLHCSFQRLCKEAEAVKLELPLKNMEIADEEEDSACNSWIDKTFSTDDEVDYVSAPFEQLKLHLFENCDNPDLFFRTSLRSLLTDHILTNLDMRYIPKTPQYYYHNDGDDDPEEDVLSKQGLPYLLMKGVYTDAFILHDESEDNFKESQHYADDHKDSHENEMDKDIIDVYGDPRHDMNVTWPYICKFQPLWKIRNYFGEEIALYFAWAGLFISSIMIPMFIGLGVFGYGLFCSVTGACSNATMEDTAHNSTTMSALDEVIETLQQVLANVKEAFDNAATPFYALAVCLWSTFFIEFWKRKNSVLAYEWDVNDFEDVEPDRPEYFGTASRKDPVTQEDIPFYPFKYKCMKFGVSFMTFLVMLCVVFAILVSVVLYRVFLTVNYCGDLGEAGCFVVTTICSSLLNAVAIMILGKVYEILAVRLTDWENHRTASAYRDALIIKLFAFQFANCYSSLYYIAFFRDVITFHHGLFGLGTQYNDYCIGSCMPDLSFQVLTLIVIKPLPKIFKDVILPWALKKFKSIFLKKKSSVDPEKSSKEEDLKTTFLETERRKPPLKDFTLNEYTEKVIQYGFVVLFAAAMPLGPLIVILFNTLDRVLDSKRLLWMYRRPVAYISQNIGMWQNILEFLNIAAVITNGFIIAFVSDWGRNLFKTNGDKLLAVLVFEHGVLLIKYGLAVVIPDVPHKIRIAIRKEKFTVAKILETGAFVKDFSNKSADGLTHSAKQSPARKPADEKRTASAVSETATARNINIDHTDHAEGGYIGDGENDSPRKVHPSSNRSPLHHRSGTRPSPRPV
ncbi:anoctamin-7-like [Watersipora subatra]|uniref:anoctamin-7-like n=1 Tax=Watersipora subatra TaxID=2589382 RepID=UPI00355BCFE8